MELSDRAITLLQAIKYEIKPDKMSIFNDNEIIEAALEYFYRKLIQEDYKYIKLIKNEKMEN